MRSTLEALSPLERTAWNDATCRATLLAQGRASMIDTFAIWLHDTCGPSPASAKLESSVAIGIAARHRAVDGLARQVLNRLEAAGMSCEIWLMGAGLDMGWAMGERPAGNAVEMIREFDLPGLIAAKSQLSERFGASPKHSLTRNAVDLADPSLSLPQTERPVLVIAEGLFDHLSEEPRGRLLAALARATPAAVLLADGLSRSGVKFDNRRPERFTGDNQLPFAEPPENLSAFHERLGWSTRGEIALFPEMARIMGERNFFWRGISVLPFPAALRRLYALYHLEIGDALP